MNKHVSDPVLVQDRPGNPTEVPRQIYEIRVWPWGIEDHSTKINSALAAAANLKNCRVVLQPGIWRIERTMEISGVGVSLVGCESGEFIHDR